MELISESFLEVKKSKFYGYLYKVDNEYEVKEVIDKLWKENKKARHIVYAYSINGVQKKFEDKEPSNSAGKPLLDIINYKNLDNTLIVVIRYFGGILLGAGPLTRTYSKTGALLFK